MTIASGIRTAAAACLFLLVACARDGGDPTPGGAPAARDPDAVALRVEHTGGFVPPADEIARLPMVTVYGDGRAILQGPQPQIYPAPALPNLQVIRISPADVDRLVDRAADAGVGTATDLGRPPIADAPSTRFTIATEDGTATTEVYALSDQASSAGLTAEQVAARAKLSELLTAVTVDLPTTLGVAPGAVQQYQPAALAAIATPYQAPEPAAGPAQPEVAWPGPALPGASVGTGLDTGCLAVTGADTAKVIAATDKANAATPWTSGGRKWTVHLRPLLPDEKGCADLLNR